MNKRVGHTNLIFRPQAFGRLRPVSSLLGLLSQSQLNNLQTSIYKRFVHASMKQPFAGMISDVSIVFCRAMFNTLSTSQDSWYARIKYNQQKHLKKSAEQKPGLSYAVRQA